MTTEIYRAEPVIPVARHSRVQLILAFAVAAVSDAVCFFTTFIPPVEWAVDFATASLLFLILGRRWAILPGLIAEAIPGLGVFPFWVLVVGSIAVYDGLKPARKVPSFLLKLLPGKDEK
jgi:hypothetical protein